MNRRQARVWGWQKRIVESAPLLDSSYLIDLERETAADEIGPARRFLQSLRGRPLVVSIVSVEEILEGAIDEAAALASLQRFTVQGLHLAQARRAREELVSLPRRRRALTRCRAAP